MKFKFLRILEVKEIISDLECNMAGDEAKLAALKQLPIDDSYGYRVPEIEQAITRIKAQLAYYNAKLEYLNKH